MNQTQAGKKPQKPTTKNFHKELKRAFVCGFAILTWLGAPGTHWPGAAAFAADATKEETLNNASIIELQGLVGDSVIIDKIKSSKCDFDVTVTGLKQLKTAKVSDDVIKAMISAKSPMANATPAPAVSSAVVTTATAIPAATVPPTGDMNDPNTYHDSGVWLYEEVGGAKKMTQLSTEAYNISHSYVPFGPGFAGSAAVLPGDAAKTQCSSRRPVFYMYFGEGRQNNMDMMGTLTPDQLPLAQLKVTSNKKKQERTISIGSSTGFGGTSGIPPKARRSVESSKVGPGIYRVTPQSDLEPGEYAFFYSPSQVQEGAAGRVFCFGIH